MEIVQEQLVPHVRRVFNLLIRWVLIEEIRSKVKPQTKARFAYGGFRNQKLILLSIIKTGFETRFRCLTLSSNQGCGSGSGSFSAEARKLYRFRLHIGGKNGGRKGIGSAILRRGANRGSTNIKK